MTTYHQPILKRDAQENVIQESYQDDMAFRGEYTADNLVFRGKARPGSAEADAVWQIAQLNYAGDNLIDISWPQGANGAASSEFIFSWTDRATYTYS